VPPAELRPGTPEHWVARAKGHLSMARQPKPSGVFWEDLAFHPNRRLSWRSRRSINCTTRRSRLLTISSGWRAVFGR